MTPFMISFILVIVTCHIILTIIYKLSAFLFDKLAHNHYTTLEVTFQVVNAFDNFSVMTAMIFDSSMDVKKIIQTLNTTYNKTGHTVIALIKIKKRHHFK